MKAVVFPGQGSQVKGMGTGLFERFPQLVRRADGILGYSISELCLADPRRELGLTQFTQPAIYVVNALSWFKRQEEGGAEPDYFAGHSLGEYNALLAAGCFDFDVGLRLVKKRGELIGQVNGGGMAAILGASRAQVASILQQSGIDSVDLAIQNSPSQCVLAGRQEDLARVEPFFRNPPFSFYPLNTSGAFHSRYMKDVGEEFGRFLAGVQFASPRVPVIANVTARPYAPGKVAELLVAQISQPVRWSESIEYLLSLGDFQFEEVGHGEVLTRIVRTITASRRAAMAHPAPTPPAPTRSARP